jgi:hypothetical protein
MHAIPARLRRMFAEVERSLQEDLRRSIVRK